MRGARRRIARHGRMLVHGVDSDSGLTARHSQQSAVVHGIEQVRRRARRAAPVVGDRAVREMRVHLAWMHRSVGADEIQQRPHVPAACRAPWDRTAARMHQRLQRAGHEAVVDEEVLVDVEPAVEALEIAGTITGHAMAEREVLGSRRRADRIGLHEAEHVERLLQRSGGNQAARDRKTPQVVEGHASRSPSRRRALRRDKGYWARVIDATWILLVLASSVPVTLTFFAANFSGVF